MNVFLTSKKFAILVICIILCIALVCIPILVIAERQTTDGAMHGSLVTPEGKVDESIDLSLSVDIQEKADERDVLKLDISLPDDFPYIFTEDYTYYNGSEGIEAMPYYTSSGLTLGRITNEPELCNFAIDDEKQWAIFVWESDPNQYLVASVDSDTDPTQIIEHFKVFLNALPVNK